MLSSTDQQISMPKLLPACHKLRQTPISTDHPTRKKSRRQSSNSQLEKPQVQMPSLPNYTSIVVTRYNLVSERFMLPLEKLCSNVLPFLVLLCVWKVVNFSTILIVNIAGSRLYRYNQRMKMLNVFCNTGDVCTEYLL